MIRVPVWACALFCLLATAAVRAEYKAVAPRENLKPGEIPVQKPGNCEQAGKTYVLTRDIAGETTPLFLGNNVTLDLNGHTVTFAAGPYQHVPNYGFEEGLKDWDTSKAPSAKAIPSAVHPMVGEKILQLAGGEEIVSRYITLPVAQRSYYAMCAVAEKQMRVTINVDDAAGRPVTCDFKGGTSKRVTPPEVDRHPELGGGVLFAHMHDLPAGKYRLRIKAETDCQIDECDIRPALDAGIAIVGAIQPYATYNDVLKWYPCAFFDYNKKDAKAGVPAEGVPMVQGTGTVTIRNGVIRNGTLGIRTLGVQSNAKDVTVVLDNVRIVNSGINANAARLAKAVLKNCRFEVDTPFIINRHDTSEMSVSVGSAAEVAGCEFLGGQGNFAGACPDIHDNLFVNAQTVTNHYSISPGIGTKVYRNRFLPKIGSGIYIGRGYGVEVFDNVFQIESAPPNCEYRYTTYSTNALRLSDYDAKPTEPAEKRCAGNRVYHNKIHILGKSYPQFDRYRPRTYAFFISVGGGANYIYDNEITIEKDQGNVGAFAFFVGGSSNGGEIHDNKIVSNCPAAWLGTDYGNAANTLFYGNTFIKAPDTPRGAKPFILGDGGNAVSGVGFFSNTFQGWTDLFEYHSRSVAYAFGWTLTVAVADKAGKPRPGAEVVVTDKDGAQTLKQAADEKGIVTARLAEYRYAGGQKSDRSHYIVKSGAAEARIDMTKDTKVTLQPD